MNQAGTALRRWGGSPGLRILLAAVAMLAVAEVAALVLAPANTGPGPLPVDPSEYFEPAAVERAQEFRDGQRLLWLAGTICELVAIAALALGRPRRLAAPLHRLARRRVLGAAAAGALVALVGRLAALPANFIAHERAVDYGVSVQGDWAWLGDVGISTVVSAVILAVAAALLAALIGRFQRGWWLPGAAVVVIIAVLITVVSPVLIEPRFNDFEPLPEGSSLRADVIELGERAGVDIGEVYRVDASRRSTTLNAYVGGLGPTKRVVLYDNLVEQAERPELESVVAHELGHVAHSDIRRGLTFVALVAPLGMLFVRELAGALARRGGARLGLPASIPALLLAIGIATFLIEIPGNQLSREVEASADAFALELTDDPQALIDLQLRTAASNLSDPDPPGWAQWAFGTHPTKLERIGAALAYERGG
jgi:STE24 endopeptidase